MSLSIALNTFALGLGELKVYSNLEQPFDAEIELIDVGNRPLSGIKASIASDADYEHVGFKRKFTGDDLAFVIEKNRQGQPVIKVRSINPISDPLIQVLIDVTWANGQVYRAYSVLLDPTDYQLTVHRTHVSPIYPQAFYPKVTAEQQAPVAEPTAKSLSAHLPMAVKLSPPVLWRYQSKIPSVAVLQRPIGNRSLSFSQPQSLLSAVPNTLAPLPSSLPVPEAANSQINAQMELTASVVASIRESNDLLKDQLSEIRAKNQILQHRLQQRDEKIATLQQQLSVLIRRQGAGGQVVASHESNQWLWLFVLLGFVAGGSYILWKQWGWPNQHRSNSRCNATAFSRVKEPFAKAESQEPESFVTPPERASAIDEQEHVIESVDDKKPIERPVRSHTALNTLLGRVTTYIEMNDIEAARQSLTEVMMHGDAKQKALAKKLFNQISSSL